MEPAEKVDPAAPQPSGPGLAERFVKVFRAIGALLARALGRLTWTPPPWSAAVAGSIRRGTGRLGAFLRAHRRAAIAAASTAIVLGAAAVVGYRLFQSRPRPLLIPVEITSPPVTAIEAKPQPQPARVTFAASAARLDRVGKVVTQGVKLEPPMPGEWRFEDDRNLVFRPSQDWPVGQEFRVTLDRTLFPEHVRLATRELTFRTAPFTARVLRAEFYQDPTDPRLKQVVVAFGFSHPADTADLARRVKLHLKGAKGGLFGLGATGQPFTLSFDKLAGEAYVRSEAIPIPDDDTAMVVTLEKGARAARGGPPIAEPVSTEVKVPGMFSYFRVESAHVTLVPNDRLEPEQVLVIETSAGATEEEIGKHVAAWVLPKNRPAQEDQPEAKNYRWRSPEEIGPEILARSTRLPLSRIPADRNDATLHSFKVQAPVGATVYVRLDKGTKSFGGYVLAREWAAVAPVPAFPQEVKVAQPGSLLSLAGEKKVSILARDVPALRFEVSRVLPGQVAHLVTQSEGAFAAPDFEYRFGPDDLTERFEEKRPLQRKAPGKAQYTAFDLARYLEAGGGHNGLFLFSVQAWDLENDRPGEATDRRFLLVTDLGLVAKRNADKSHDVFVQSVRSGVPAAGVTVQVLGRNGLPVVSENTDAQGHVHFPALGDFKREKAPVAFLARKGEDVSFLPFDRSDRRLEVSRFDVGGIVTGGKGARLDAFVFSDRGLYRPGDQVHLALAVKSADWSAPLEGVPLETTVTDPRGLEVQKERLALPRTGLSELSYRTEETSPTGTYAASVYLVEANGNRGALLGSTSFRVEEFLPDRMRISAHLSTERAEGWVSPTDLSARVSLQNLFGIAAEKRRVAAQFTLEPAYPRFQAFKDYAFTDPLKAKNSYSESLPDGETNEKGEVELALDLSRFEKATYRLGFVAQGFEADGGRGVSAATGVLVSPLPYLVGYKADGELRYVSRGTARALHLVAVGPDAAAREVKGLTAELVELRWVSVLEKKDDGTYRYESVQREISKEKKPLSIPAKGLGYALPTGEPGDFEIRIQDAAGLEFSRIPFSVAGAGNLARNLEKNAELQLKLARSDFGPGEAIELQITAPYVGAGLITIERDRVYAWKWFKTTTTSTVETIEVPPDLEGNGYVSVAFVRALDSKEIFTSPLSFGVSPFSVSRANRTIDVDLSTPELARPGEVFPIRYKGSKPGKAVVFVVDEGILQVARYKTPDPLGHFFEKRALEVSTQQILDLILPEFSVVQAVSASGGDEGQAALAHNLNPFKRKRDQPAVYWSGIVDIDEKERTLEWRVPDTFNGQVRVMAVAVSPEALGANARDAIVRGPFVLSPNAPTFVAPGDTFEVSVAVANNVEGSGKAAKVKLEISASEHLDLSGAGERTLEIGEGREASATFQVKARGKLGSASLGFVASLGGKRSKQTVDVSIRPAVPYETLILGGRLEHGATVEPPLARRMVPEYRTLEASASPLPLCMARGLIQYLARYPHGCTEQLVSQAVPAIVLRDRPEFGFGPEKVEQNLAAVLRTLRSRQNGEGAFGMWAGNGYVSDFQTVYALHFLTEAKERSYPVPQDLLSRALGYARGLAAARPSSLAQARLQAYALYVVTRNGVVTTRELSGLREALEAHKDWPWKKDLTAVHLAATYALLKQEAQASRLIGEARMGTQQAADYDGFYDGLVYDAQLLYVLSRHFPARLRSLPPEALDAIARPIADGAYNSLSSAYTVLALDAYARASGVDRRTVDASVFELLADGKARPITLPEGLFPRADFTEQATKLRVKSTGDLPVFWQATLAGFESSVPRAEVKQKLEIFREYQDASGKVVTQVRQGDELEVHLRVRSLAGLVSNVALIDLLPGGFEPVIEQRIRSEGAAEEESPEAGDSEEATAGGEDEGDAGDAEEAAPAGRQAASADQPAPSVEDLPVGLDKSTWIPGYADVREDRVVVYGPVGPDLKEFVYRIKATNRGTFTIPPPLGESMYDRSVKARGLPGQMKVVGRD
jgi:uncharacterized protein YfaS (alpha-2-macroglobulin family)